MSTVATAAEVIDLSDESELISIFYSLLSSFFSIFILESLPQKRKINKKINKKKRIKMKKLKILMHFRIPRMILKVIEK